MYSESEAREINKQRKRKQVEEAKRKQKLRHDIEEVEFFIKCGALGDTKHG